MRLPDLSRLSLVGGAPEWPPSPEPLGVLLDAVSARLIDEDPERAVAFATQLYELVPMVARTGGHDIDVVKAETQLYAALTERHRNTTQEEMVADLIHEMLVERTDAYMQRVKEASSPAAVEELSQSGEELRRYLAKYLTNEIMRNKQKIERGHYHAWACLSTIYHTKLMDAAESDDLLKPDGDDGLVPTHFLWNNKPSDGTELKAMQEMKRARIKALGEKRAAKKQKKQAAAGDAGG
tara:strand:- start:366 stop:1079 length:714 start_codon:yes stop_codon:yes gene_type:complete